MVVSYRCALTLSSASISSSAHMAKQYSFIPLFVSGFAVAFYSLGLPAKSEPLRVRPDGTTQTTLVGGIDCATDCTVLGGSRLDDSLFHSFSELSIPAGVTATFESGGAANIFARVSGIASTIEGTLAIAGGGQTNFFLINPRGIIFGPESALVSPGSFIASTADSVMFSNGVRFSATDSTLPTLQVSAPIGFQFGDRPGSIINRSQASLAGASNALGEPAGLEVDAGRTLSLVGGFVALENGSLTASSGRIGIGSVAANSQVLLLPDLRLGYSDTEAFGDIQLTDRSLVDASGEGGQITLQGRSVTVAEQSAITNFSLGSSSTGSIALIASESVVITGTGILFSAFDGDGASLSIATRQLTVTSGALISGGTFGAGDGGTLTINASDAVTLRGSGRFSPSLITTSTEGSGAGGDLIINTRQLTVTEGAQIQSVSFGAGSGGNLAINTDSLSINEGSRIAVDSFGLGDSGTLAVNARSLRLDNGARLTAAAAFGNGGNIRLDNLETLVLRRGSVISAQAGTGNGMGNGGNIAIEAGFVVAAPLEDSDIIARAAQGRGGNITIETLGLYGIAERRAIAGNRTNDVDASSDFGISGTIAVDQPTANVDQATTELPRQVLESEAAVVQSCQAEDNRFVITGRGGLPAAPTEAIEITAPLIDLGPVDWETLPPAPLSSSEAALSPTEKPGENSLTSSGWIEASSWATNNQNQIVLTTAPQAATSDGQIDAPCAG